MKHLYGGFNPQQLANVTGIQTSQLVEVKRVFSKVSVGSLVRVHMLEVTHEPPEGASLQVYRDYYKGVLDMYTPDMLKILVRAEEEVEPTIVRINIEEVLDAPEVTTYVFANTVDDEVASEFIQDIIEYLDEKSTNMYLIEVI